MGENRLTVGNRLIVFMVSLVLTSLDNYNNAGFGNANTIEKAWRSETTAA